MRSCDRAFLPIRLGSPSQSGSVAPDSPRKSAWDADTPVVWQRQIPVRVETIARRQ